MNYFKSAMVNQQANQNGIQTITLETGTNSSASALVLVSPMVLVTAIGPVAVDIECDGVTWETYGQAAETGYFRLPAVLFAAAPNNGAYQLQFRVSMTSSTFDDSCWITASVVELEQPDR